MTSQKKLLILTNTPTPYRTPFFNALQEVLHLYNIELFVMYCALKEPHRMWKIDLAEQQYRWKILSGIHPSFSHWYPHINPTILRELGQHQPCWLLIAGAWNTPTMLLAASPVVTKQTKRIFWSEGHEDAVRHSSGAIAKLRQLALNWYDGFAVPNQRSEEFVSREIGSRIMLPLPNTVDEDFYSGAYEIDRLKIRAQWGLLADEIVFAFVGQLEDRKGVIELVDAIYNLNINKLEPFHLLMAGDGSLRALLAQKIIDANIPVTLLGHLTKEEVREVLAASDAFILPTKQDPNPLSVIEAAFSSLPLLVSKKAGNVNELVHPEQNGLIIDFVEANCIAKNLERFLQYDSIKRDALGRASYEIAQKGFRRETVAQKFVENLIEAFPC